MKRLFLLLSMLLLCIILTFGFTSCKIKGNSPNADNPSHNGTPQGDFIYRNDSSLYLISDSEDDAFSLLNEINSLSSANVYVADSSASVNPHEIIIGDCKRNLSVEAYRLLNRMLNRIIDDGKDNAYLNRSRVIVNDS